MTLVQDTRPARSAPPLSITVRDCFGGVAAFGPLFGPRPFPSRAVFGPISADHETTGDRVRLWLSVVVSEGYCPLRGGKSSRQGRAECYTRGMALPFSKSQIERLGRRLVEQSLPAEVDLDDLAALLGAYDEVLAAASREVRDLGYAPTGRLKNTGTILEKLRRQGGTWLKSIQDLAGLRVVIEGGLRAQDQVAEEIMQCFAGCPKAPKLIDRREDPRQGYRAVHVIVFPEGIPVEVQIRTHLQHGWAEVFEKLADLVGREIRYGEDWWLPGEREVPQALGLNPHVDLLLKEAAKSIEQTKEGVNLLIDVLFTISANIAELEDILTDPRVPLKRAEALQARFRESLDAARPVIEGVEASIASYKVLQQEARSLGERIGRVPSKDD